MDFKHCSVEDCSRFAKARGLCGKHYSAATRKGILPPKKGRTPVSCSIEGCSHAVVAWGWCRSHYRRWKRWGDPLWSRAANRRHTCSIEGCDGVPKGRGWCSLHYDAWQRHGNPLGGKRHAKSGSGYVMPSGYRVMRMNGRQVYEHRYVMETVLGRPLARTENVHHKDGNKLNNDPSNLEVLTTREHMRVHSTMRECCKRGHPYSLENTRYFSHASGRTRRACRTCERMRYENQRAQRRAL